MTLMNFETELDLAGKRRMVVSADVEVSATIHVSKSAPLSEQTSYLARGGSQWGWSDLRDYVVREIEKRFGAFPRDLVKEAGIFKGFMNRWGEKAPAIAKAAFEVHDGMWRGAPIAVTRFTVGNDPYFARIIASNIL